MPDKKVWISVPSYRSSAQGFTVKSSQEYVIQVSVYAGDIFLVFKRYSDLLKINESLASITKKLGIKLPKFPPKKLQPRSQAVILKRLTMFEAWLQELFNYSPLVAYAVSSLALPEYLVFIVATQSGCIPMSNTNDAEMLVLTFIEFISTAENGRGEVIASLRKAVLNSRSSLNTDVLGLLVRFLLHMLSDPELSNESIKFLLKLMCNQKYADVCATELLALDIELLRSVELNYLLVQDMPKLNDTVFELLCKLKQRLSKQMRSCMLVNIVRSTQLNEDSYAIGVFMEEYCARYVYL